MFCGHGRKINFLPCNRCLRYPAAFETRRYGKHSRTGYLQAAGGLPPAAQVQPGVFTITLIAMCKCYMNQSLYQRKRLHNKFRCRLKLWHSFFKKNQE